MQLINASDVDFEAVRVQAEAIVKDADQWLASINVDQFEKACVQGQAALVYEDEFKASDAAQRAMRASVLQKMVGPEASLKFLAGLLGSIWFDVEVNDPDTAKPRPLRVALTPPGTRPKSWACKDAQFVFAIHCLASMYE